MPSQAQIEINAAVGNKFDLPINVLVQLSNNDLGGEATWAWTIVSKPRASTATLSNPAIENPTFTPDVEGTYLLNLVVDAGLGTQDIDQVVAVVPHLKATSRRMPAAKETTEASATEGWAVGPSPSGVNDLIDFLILNSAQGGLVCCSAGEALAVGNCVVATDTTTLKTGLPGEEKVPHIHKVQADTLAHALGRIGVVAKKITPGGGGVGLGELCYVQFDGPVLGSINTVGRSVGDLVFVTDVLGVLGFSPGTVEVVVGYVIGPIGATGSIMVQPAVPAINVTQNYLVSGAAIAKYDIVTLDGLKFDASNSAHMRKFAGIAAQAAAGPGTVIVYWKPLVYVSNGAWAWSAVGVPLFADPAVPGGMTETPPAVGPAGILQVGIVGPLAVTQVMPVEREPLWLP